MSERALSLTEAADRNILHCSFCGDSQHQVETLIIESRPDGTGIVGICDRCIGACVDVLAERQQAALDEIGRLGT